MDFSSITLRWLGLHYLDFSYIRNVLTLETKSIAWCQYQRDRSLHLETNFKNSPHSWSQLFMCDWWMWGFTWPRHPIFLHLCTQDTSAHTKLSLPLRRKASRTQKPVVFRGCRVWIRGCLHSAVRNLRGFSSQTILPHYFPRCNFPVCFQISKTKFYSWLFVFICQLASFMLAKPSVQLLIGISSGKQMWCFM